MAIAPEPMLEAEHVDKRFPGVHALDDVSLTVSQGEVHAVVGENGAGKSTLMKILAGAYSPDRGTVRVNGESVAIESPRAAQELGIITIYQRGRGRVGGSTGPPSGGGRASCWTVSGCTSVRRLTCET